ncbi:hypothetical protein LSCM1_07464 [Leishmania martiniquensis]|uniref:Trafficking protein particle complex subunit 13 N-terminal domain-containing protein n=1 Tax=Leishmania martiniquensis TaxID=1580590 RepID=A0A836H9V9_9TRYP|nr:hypothetical protein LSCM1_07464 [Leishmania martiniquensis]
MRSAAAPDRATAVAGPPTSSAAQQSTASGVTVTSLAPSTDATVMLTAPLGLQATVLSQPTFFPSLGEGLGDLTEEGDILFPVLGDPWSRVRCRQAPSRRPRSPPAASAPPTREVAATPVNVCLSAYFCVQPVLTLPRKMGALLASEVFRALLCFHNAASYSLTQAHFHVGVAQPASLLRRVVLRRTVVTLLPKSHYTIVASVPLSEASTYALTVTVNYYDPSGRQRQLTWNSAFKTEQPIVEAQPRCLRCVRSTWMVPKGKTGGGDDRESELCSPTSSRTYALYQLSIGLKNMSSVPLHLVAAELILPTLTHRHGAALFCEMEAADRHVVSAKERKNCDVAPSASAPVLLMPGDTHSALFTVGILREELRCAAVVHGRGGVMARLLSPRLASLGHVRWAWCRANGETGAAQSAPLRVEQLLAETEVALRVTHVTAASAAHPLATAALEGGDAAAGPHGHRTLHEQASSAHLLAGSPVTVHFKVLSHSSVHRYDMAVKVRVERLAPQWLYTGPTVRLLGLLDPASSVTFSLTLLPWQAGWLSLARDAIELVDARMPEAVLWPPPATATLHPVSAESDAALGPAARTNSDRAEATGPATLVATVPEIAAVALKALPAADAELLCDVLVL